MPWKVSPLLMIEDMRQRSRVYWIALARMLSTHERTAACKDTASRLLPERTHARTHAHLGLLLALSLAGH
jgi:hypothetical protein